MKPITFPDSFQVSITVDVPPNILEKTAKEAGGFYMDRILSSLQAVSIRKTVSHLGYVLDGRGSVELYLVIPRDGLTPERVKQALLDNDGYFAHGIVISTNELYTRGIRGSQKYETVVV